MSLNYISFWTTCPNSINFTRVLFQNCINGSAPPNRRTTRAPDKKYFKQHLLLNHWPKFNINSQNCFSWRTLPKFHKWFHSTDQSFSVERPRALLLNASYHRNMNIYGLGVGISYKDFQNWLGLGMPPDQLLSPGFQTYLQNFMSIFNIFKNIRMIPSVVSKQ